MRLAAIISRVTLARDVIAYLEGLTLPNGAPFTLMPWQRRFIRSAFAPAGAGGVHSLSLGRKNGKTALAAALCAAVVDPDGPLWAPDAEVVMAAASHEQARTAFRDVRGFLARRRGDLDGRRVWRQIDSTSVAALEHRASGSRARCVGANPRTLHGARPRLVLADEGAQWQPAHADAMFSALRTSLADEQARMLCIGTRPASGDHWFERLLTGERPSGVRQLHTCEPGDEYTVRGLRRANPSYDDPRFGGLRRLLRDAIAEARTGDPSAQARLAALHGNVGTSDVAGASLVSADRWREIEIDEPDRDGPYSLGVDLATTGMAAVAAHWPETGALEAVGGFAHRPGLKERGLQDGVGSRYVRMAERGEIVQLGERALDVGGLMREAVARWGNPHVITTDLWRLAELEDALGEAGVPRVPVVTRRHGPRDGGEDVRAFHRHVALGDVRPVRSLLLRHAVSESRLQGDASGNVWLATRTVAGRRMRGRDDAAVAALLAVSTGTAAPFVTPSMRRSA